MTLQEIWGTIPRIWKIISLIILIISGILGVFLIWLVIISIILLIIHLTSKERYPIFENKQFKCQEKALEMATDIIGQYDNRIISITYEVNEDKIQMFTVKQLENEIIMLEGIVGKGTISFNKIYIVPQNAEEYFKCILNKLGFDHPGSTELILLDIRHPNSKITKIINDLNFKY